MINLFDTFLGGEGKYIKRPFAEIGGCPIVSPLRFGKDNADLICIGKKGISFTSTDADSTVATDLGVGGDYTMTIFKSLSGSSLY